VSASSTAGTCGEASGTVTCDVGDLAASTDATITIVVTPLSAGTVNNTASASADSPMDPSQNNNTATSATSVEDEDNPPTEQCTTIEFEGAGSHGTLVDGFDLDGTTISLTVVPRGSQSTSSAAIYDTDNVDGPDTDLEWQGSAPICTDCQGQGNALVIVSNAGFDSEGDSGSGGTFVLTGFTPGAWTLRSFTAIDADGASFRALIDGANSGGSSVGANGSVESVDVSGPTINSELRLDIGTDSGAIDDLEFCTASSGD
jgi:hypothetical protein